PFTSTSWTKLKETMSRERPGNLTFFSASRTCSGLGILLLLSESLIGLADDVDGVRRRVDDVHCLHIRRADEAALDHGRAHPVAQTGPHCTDEDERMLLHVLHLQELPHHEELEGRADAARHDDERRRKPDEMMQAREERAVAKDLVDEGIGPLLGREMDGQTE